MATSARVRAAGRLGSSLAPTLDVRWVLAVVLGALVGWLVLPPLVAYGLIAGERLLPLPGRTPMRIEATGQQWHWAFRYPDHGGVTSKDVIHLPAGTLVDIVVTSRDVIHAFWVPEFLFKRDVFPMPDKNDTDKTFVIDKIERQGAFVGRCAELCGSYHSAMNFEVRALSPQLYDQYLRLRTQNNPQTNAPNTAGEALAALNCGELCAPDAITTYPFNTKRTDRAASVRPAS